jgi:protein-tyrosine-phosphatase
MIGGSMALVMIVGAADTGRAPIAAALLRRRLEERQIAHRVESAGILGHDDDPVSGEALAAADQIGIDLSDHRARSLTEELAAEAVALIAIDSGIARVARARYPEAAARIATLGEMAGRQRDIPDPFKMQLGAWLAYLREIEQLLALALPRIIALLEPNATQQAAAAPEAPAGPRGAAVAAALQALDLAQNEWSVARAQLDAALAQALAAPRPADDLAEAYVGMVRVALTLTPTAPSVGQRAALVGAVERLRAPISAADIAALSAQLGVWGTL